MSFYSALCLGFNRGACTQRRRVFRINASVANGVLWSRLRNRQQREFKFRHIHSIGFSIVDFYCASARLAIVISEKPNRKWQTGIRNEDIEGMPGLRVLEFSHDEVLENTEEVIRIIERELSDLDPYFEKDSIRFKGSQLKRVPRPYLR